MTPPIALTIAGSDPSGGAGVQADLRTWAAQGVAGVSVVTALTVQNSRGVTAVHPVPADVLAAQLDAVLSDTRPQTVKIGMLGGAAQVRAVADVLRRYAPPHIILDPVLSSAGGVPLLDEAGRAALVTDLLPLCELVTPNQDEWAALPGLQNANVLLKGGHLPGPPTDVLTLRDGARTEFLGTRIDTPHTHGTGCLLSAAIAGYLAWGYPLTEAIRAAKALLTMALRVPVVVGHGRGYPDALRATGHSPQPNSHARRLALVRGIYVLTDTHLRPERSAEDITRAALAGGARIIQLRDKTLPTPLLISLARRLAERTHQAKALLIINDRVDVALASGADGVHLGPDDMHPRDARALLGPDKIVGISISTPEEAEGKAEYASYLGVGALFGTLTKADAGPPVGMARLAEIAAAYPSHPLVGIGGITLDNVALVAEAGAEAAAVVSAVVSAPDMTAATAALADAFASGKHRG